MFNIINIVNQITMRSALKLILNINGTLLMSLVLIILLHFELILACDCAGPASPGDEFETRDAVFSGQVVQISIDSVGYPLNYIIRVNFLVYQFWKGVEEQELSIITGYDEGQCGYYFEVDTVYLVYADSLSLYSAYIDSSDSSLQTHICTRTKRFSYADEDLEFLNGLGVGGVETPIERIPNTYQLYSNYPNPFNPTTTIQYELPHRSDVQITIYDLLGRKVTMLVSETQDAGFKSVTWNANNDFGKPVNAGVYLYQIQAGEFVQTRKMVLLK